MRLFVVFRTFDRIWTCKTYTRELAPFELDMSMGAIKLMFMVDHIVSGSDGKELYIQHSHLFAKSGILPRDSVVFYCQPHNNFYPKIIKNCKQDPEEEVMKTENNRTCLRRYSVPSLDLNMQSSNELFEKKTSDIIYFVLPKLRCTVLLDAHFASSINYECSRSRTFRRRLWQYLVKGNGFRDCVPDYEMWTEEERDAWDNYLSVPFMIDLVAVWPKQKIDYAWCKRTLGLLNKHVVLMEGFAWLSTLGGAHSSLGETFVHHAEKAGEISVKQLKLALELGNESLTARCYIFWSWSLLQRGELRRCKACVLNTWRFCHTIRGGDWILEAMCRAVWSKLRYKLSLRRKYNRHLRAKKQSSDDGGGGDCGRNISALGVRGNQAGDSCLGQDRSPTFVDLNVKSPTRGVSTVKVV